MHPPGKTKGRCAPLTCQLHMKRVMKPFVAPQGAPSRLIMSGGAEDFRSENKTWGRGVRLAAQHVIWGWSEMHCGWLNVFHKRLIAGKKQSKLQLVMDDWKNTFLLSFMHKMAKHIHPVFTNCNKIWRLLRWYLVCSGFIVPLFLRKWKDRWLLLSLRAATTRCQWRVSSY